MDPIKESTYLKHCLQLEKFDSNEYSEKVDCQGCKPFFRTPVYKKKANTDLEESKVAEETLQDKKQTLINRLKKEKEPELNKRVLEAFAHWGVGDYVTSMGLRSAVWIADTLAIDLNLYAGKKRPKALATQILFLAEQRPMILASVVRPRDRTDRAMKHEDIETVSEYTITCAQRLKSSLANFSSSDFAILRFTLDINDATRSGIRSAVQEQLDFTRIFFKGRVEMTSESFADIEWAVQALTSGSNVPCLLQSKTTHTKVSMLLLDDPWSTGLSLAIETLNQSGELRCPQSADFKVKVAVLEAALRFSYNTEVVITSEDDNIEKLIRDVKTQAKRDLKPEPKLIFEPSRNKTEEWATVTLHPDDDASDEKKDISTAASALTESEFDPSETLPLWERVQVTGKPGEAEFLSAWFPHLDTESYIIPPLHFNTVHAEEVSIGKQKVKILKTRKKLSQKNTFRNTESKESLSIDNILKRIHFCMNQIKEKAASKNKNHKEAMVIMTEAKCGLYKSLYAGATDINNNAVSSTAAQVVWNLKKDLADLLVIHRDHGVLMGAVVGKTSKDPTELHNDINNAVDYLNEAERVVKEFILPNIEGASAVTIRKTILFPNVMKDDLQELLRDGAIMKKLEQCLGIEPGKDFSQLFLCEDDMADDTRLDSWWSACLIRKEGGDPAMKGQSVYKQLVARFSLPLTTVQMFLGRQPRLQIWTQGHVVQAVGEEFGRDFTRLALFPSQLEVLEERPDEDEEDDVRILHGPPGTAKTVVLVLKGMQWLSEDCKIVFVLQTSSDGAAAAFLVSHQLRKSARRGNDSVHLITLLDVWDSYKHEWKEGGEQKLRSLVQTLRQHAKTVQNKAVHILADEANCVVVSKLFKALKDPQESYITVRLWAAGVDLEIPADMQDKVRKLTEPLRCPPSVVAEVEQAWDLSDGKVPTFSRPTVQLVSTGPPVLVVEHYHRRCKERHGHVTQGFDYPWRCEECGRQVAKKLLEELHVGRHDYAAPGQGSLTFNDVFVLGSTIDCRATTTDDHNNSPAPFIRGLQSLSTFIPTRKVGEDDTETIRMLAEMSTRTTGVSETKTRGSFTDENSRAEMISTTSRDAGGSNFIIDNAPIGVDRNSLKTDAEMQEASPAAETTVLQKTDKIDNSDAVTDKIDTSDAVTDKIDNSDAVTVVREENIWGLERKVIVYLDQGGNFGADGTGRLRSFSRSTSQLIWVRPVMHTANTRLMNN